VEAAPELVAIFVEENERENAGFNRVTEGRNRSRAEQEAGWGKLCQTEGN